MIEACPECVGIHEVRERQLTVDLDCRQQLAIPRLELRPPADVDQLELERELVVQLRDHLERARAKGAVGRVVDDDSGARS